MQIPLKNFPESCTYMEPIAYNFRGVSDLVKGSMCSRLSTILSRNLTKQGADTTALVNQTSLSPSLPSTCPVTSEEESGAGLKLCNQ